MNPVTVANPELNLAPQPNQIGITSNSSMIGGGLALVGLVLTSKHPIIGIPLLLFGLGNIQMFDCYIIASGNTYAGQKQCQSLISKLIGPM